jgi:hypothetical protein
MMLPVMLAAIFGGLIVWAGSDRRAQKALMPVPPKLPPTPREIRMLTLMVLYDKDQALPRAQKVAGQAHLTKPMAVELCKILILARLPRAAQAVNLDRPFPEDERYLGRGFSVADASRIYGKLGRI